ncbi:MAG: PRC-barrel domain-containing protein [Kiloniellaceae bacterium]
MIRSTTELRRYDIAARDGSLGDVHDIFFDDHSWKVRYLVIDTGNWLPGRRVLVSPESVTGIEADGGKVGLTLTKDEIKDSPGIEADAPVSRQNEIALANHFRWPRYWEEYPSGIGLTPMIPHLQHETAAAAAAPPANDAIPQGDPNLRSAAEVSGYHVAAKDGEIGHIDDLLIDDTDWTLRFLVADTRNWLPGRKVLVAPAWTRGIDWSDEKLHIDAERETIKAAPEYEPGMQIDAALERRIFQHYGREA